MTIKCHLVSFADGQFLSRAQSFQREALASRFFDTIQIYNSNTLDRTYQAEHREFMSRNERGFGFYIWKPQCVVQALENIGSSDLLVWLDAGFEINAQGRQRFFEYLQIAMDSAFKMLSFSNTHTEYRWTKMDLAHRLGLSPSSTLLMTTQLTSGCFILQKSRSNVDLILEWKKLAVESQYHYSDNTPSIAANHPEFVEHRHDQSIFSLLRKLRGTEVTHYEVQSYASHFEKLKDRLPLRASRKGRNPRT